MTVADLSDYRAAKDLAAITEMPTEVLPWVTDIDGPVCVDTETSGLFVDSGATVAAVSVAYRLKSDPGFIYHHAFPFDQGRATDKGFTTLYYLDTPTYRKRGHVGRPKGDPDLMWDWDTDYNLDAVQWTCLMRWLQEAAEAHGVFGANLKFDLHQVLNGTRHFDGVELEKWACWDTQLVSAELWPGELTGLKPTAIRLWGADEADEADLVKQALVEVKKRYGLTQEHGPRYDLMPWEVNGPYASQDAVLTYRLREHQIALLEDGQGSWHHIQQATQLMRVLYRMEKRGFGPLDIAKAKSEADRIHARVAELEPIFPFQPPTAAHASEYFFDHLGLTPWNVGGGEEPRTKEIVPDRRKGQPVGATRLKITKQGTLTASVARRMGAAGVEFANEYAEYIELKIWNQMFYQNYLNLASPEDRTLRTNHKQAFVKSGRMAVERFQAQAIPKKINAAVNGEPLIEPRKLILVDEGRTRLGLDLNQAELRIAVQMADCDTMRQLLAAGADLHGDTTRRTFEIERDHTDWDELRDAAKRLNFSAIFMVGPKTFRHTLWKDTETDWSYQRCADAVYSWRSVYPEFEAAYNYWMRFAERNRYVLLIDNQPSWFLRPNDWPNSAWSRVVQSSLGLFVRDWLIKIEVMTARYGALRLTVHDSVLLDLPHAVHDQVRDDIIEMTETMWYDWFKIPGGCSVSPFVKGG